MTDEDLINLAYRAGLLEELQLLAEADPELADTEQVRQTMLDFARMVMEACGADAGDWRR